VRAFITGVNGFAGAHLASALLNAGHDVLGISEKPQERSILPSDVPVLEADVCDQSSVESRLADYEPDIVFHLAGFASPSESRPKSEQCFSVNVLGTANLLEAVARTVPGSRIVVATSAHFHRASDDGRIDEDSLFEAKEPYSTSKICAHYLCAYYHSGRGLDVVEARPTNHYGPGQKQGFVVADFASQVARIEAGARRGSVRVGNLDVFRDFLYAGDVAQAYMALAENGRTGQSYCVGSGRAVRVGDILEALADISGCEVEIEVDPGLVRKSETPRISVNSEKLHRDTGWQPATELNKGLELTLDYWRFRVVDRQ
jgi:GDP-4-dehydro-6-deoxy-D-mannose reductase